MRTTLFQLMESDRIQVRSSIPLLEERFPRIFRTILYEISSHEEVIDHLVKLHITDAHLFNHSLNVAILSGIIGLAYQYDNGMMLELTIGALLFDVGMIRIPTQIIKSKQNLSKSERTKLESHTIEGYYILKKLQGVSERTARCALLHHERYDGMGYPYGFKHEQIEEFPQIIAISDVYDALISPRHHRHAFTPNEATEFLFAAGNHYFDLELVKAFLNHISIYPVSSMVVLNNGKIGVVSSVDTRLSYTH